MLSEAPAAAPAPKQEQPKQEPPKQEQEQEEKPAEQPAPQQNGQPKTDSGRMIVSPLAARMAAEAGIDLRSLQGSGPGGRIVKRDIEAAISQPKPEPSFPRVVPAGQIPQIGASAYRDEPASEIRKTIARRLVTSLGPVPHFFLTTEMEMDRAAEMRRGINALDPDLKISINDVIIKVAAAALIQHPEVNASFQEKFVRYYERADVGVAVAIEDGLITPVVRAADQKSLSQIATEVRELAERARSRRLKPEEYTGATFSISNLGMFGIDEFTAVINPPEGAILAVGAMSPKPVVRDNEIVIRQMMRVTMSCDHRVIDGATGAKFLQTFKKILENPLYLVV
jgi:pyruvate dehydrogenase E2 component (dihydrolipoamide acetyltransferase)